jgi:hypothetical protein
MGDDGLISQSDGALYWKLREGKNLILIEYVKQ